MKNAKWLLLVAVGILMVLPGCKQLNPVVNPDVRIATEFTYTDPLATDPEPNILYAGKTIPCGFVTAYYGFNSVLNGEPVDPYLCIKYETTGDWRLSECQLDLWHTQPTEKGSPGLYDFLSGEINTTVYTFEIPLDSLLANGWNLNDPMYLLAHAAVYNDANQNGIFDEGEQSETAYPGYYDEKPWFRWFSLTLRPPEYNGETEYHGETAWGYNIEDQSHWFWALGPTYKWGGVMPYTLGSTTATFDLWAGAGQNDPSKGTIVGSVTVTDDVTLGVGKVYVHYVLTDGCLASEAHAGADKDLAALSNKSNKFAPGKLGVNGYYSPWDDDFTLVIPYESAWGNSFVVAAHAVVYIPIPPSGQGIAK